MALGLHARRARASGRSEGVALGRSRVGLDSQLLRLVLSTVDVEVAETAGVGEAGRAAEGHEERVSRTNFFGV